MSNEIRIIDQDGVTASVAQLRSKAFVSELTNEDLENVAYTAKALKNPIKNIDDEVKKRLANGSQFVHISTSEVSKQTLASDDDKVKQAFYNKYGLAAFVVKSPTQLKKEFGEKIQADLDKVVVFSKQNRVKYD
ncbi:hypothetical protein ACFIUV_08510 [Oenococcus oeni]|uniref:Uncharacterized protein n=8 Tax=Oenococcus oeni TaxID=1247 RepID=D3LC87_OENOE|nr:hypothetical protein [Oenococcus oeni]EFD87534.1 hypothetical protein AWRIB429_1967 [Oenococcus oeni AWRIB429]EJN91671.1 hypothetical protein AWRIB304_1634 [Oenococcus oeni AWRIB304]EJO10501.1 putative phage protein [Oenococcus oeni AWRIB576]EJO11280.1 putative phage protein [Oenococcus oeni AWRIB568]KGH55247.1 hypothetical protein X463_07745 [Oenococcus oeni S22]